MFGQFLLSELTAVFPLQITKKSLITFVFFNPKSALFYCYKPVITIIRLDTVEPTRVE